MKNTKLKKLWFHHDFNARNDPKLLEVNMEVGTHGIAIFWMVVEMLYENDGYLSERELKTLIFTFHLNKEDVNKVLEICFDKDSKGASLTLFQRFFELSLIFFEISPISCNSSITRLLVILPLESLSKHISKTLLTSSLLR